jgi:hypothetical protein
MGQSPIFSNSFNEDAPIAMTNMFIETSLMQYYDNDDDIYNHDHGIKMNELLLVSRIIYPLLNKANHVKVEAHMSPPLPLTSLSFPQYPMYKIENNRKQHSEIHA